MSAVFSGADMLQENNGSGYGISDQFTMIAYIKRSADTSLDQSCIALLPWDFSGSYYDVRFDLDLTTIESNKYGDNTNRRTYKTGYTGNGTWYQIILRQKTGGVDAEIWADGTKFTFYSGGPAGTVSFSKLGAVNIGSFFSGNLELNGKVAEVGIWTSALSDADVALLYNDTKRINQVAKSDLVRYWPLYDDLTDFTTNGGDQAIHTGTPTLDDADHPTDPPISSEIQPLMGYYMNMMRG